MQTTQPVVIGMEVSDPWASFIFEGRKKVEVRKNDPSKWGSVKKGDLLHIINKTTKMIQIFTVVETRAYESLDACLVAEGVRNLLPGKTTLKEARDVYLAFDGTSKEAIQKREEEYKKFGCVAIELTPKWAIHRLDQIRNLDADLKLHVEGSPNPDGNSDCPHVWINGAKAIEYNDDTMGGCGSGWNSRCNRCGKVWYD